MSDPSGALPSSAAATQCRPVDSNRTESGDLALTKIISLVGTRRQCPLLLPRGCSWVATEGSQKFQRRPYHSEIYLFSSGHEEPYSRPSFWRLNMSDNGSFNGPRVSRRDFLFATAVGSGAIVGASLVGSVPAYASNKIPQKAVSYQATPKGNQRCDGCALWQGSSSCKLVDGTIAPSGWCSLFKKK